MLYIGIDLGTSAVKLLLMDNQGNVLHIVTKEYGICFPYTGWAEQDPEDWWNQTIAGLVELTRGYDRDRIRGIGVGGQMHGLVILDENDNVIRPAILWNDGRAAEEALYLNDIIGSDKIARYTGNIAFAGFTAPKLLWLKKNEPEHFKKIKRIMLPKDYIIYRLTGVYCSDYSDASGTLLLDVEHKCWSKEMQEICDIDDIDLPELVESYDTAGILKSEVAHLLGIPVDCCVAGGAGDNAAAAIGTGTTGEGKCNISLGTSGTIFVSDNRFRSGVNHAIHAFAHADGRYHYMACMLTAASCVKWWVEDILGSKDIAAEQTDIKKLGKNQIFFLPYLMGERSPINDPHAKGAFVGMSLNSSRAEMMQAVLEGVAFALRDSLEIMKELGVRPVESTICGGGSRSVLWKNIIANVLNIRLRTVKVEEGPSYGGAILAAAACGEYASLDEAVQHIVKYEDCIEPDPYLVERYNRKYEIYHKIYPALKDIMHNVDM
ncbi:MAG: xylulokinase [Wujia sp.]